MENKKLRWCFNLKEGLRMVEPDERLAKSYLREAKVSNKRIDAQYYMKIDKKREVREMLREAKIFLSVFDNIVSDLDGKEIKEYR